MEINVKKYGRKTVGKGEIEMDQVESLWSLFMSCSNLILFALIVYYTAKKKK